MHKVFFAIVIFCCGWAFGALLQTYLIISLNEKPNKNVYFENENKKKAPWRNYSESNNPSKGRINLIQ